MFDGKMLRGLTGTPMRRIAFANSVFADAEPEPLTLANLTTKSLTASIGFISGHLERRLPGIPARRAGVGEIEQELLHVPRPGRAALGAQAAVEADVLVLDHHAAGLEGVGDIEVLGQVRRRRLQPCAQVLLLAVGRERDAVHRPDVHARVALDAELRGEYRLDIAIEAALRLLERGLRVEAELDLDFDVLEGLVDVAPRHLEALVEGDV